MLFCPHNNKHEFYVTLNDEVTEEEDARKILDFVQTRYLSHVVGKPWFDQKMLLSL